MQVVLFSPAVVLDSSEMRPPKIFIQIKFVSLEEESGYSTFSCMPRKETFWECATKMDWKFFFPNPISEYYPPRAIIRSTVSSSCPKRAALELWSRAVLQQTKCCESEAIFLQRISTPYILLLYILCFLYTGTQARRNGRGICGRWSQRNWPGLGCLQGPAPGPLLKIK